MTSPSRQAGTAGMQTVSGTSATTFAPTKPTASASGKLLFAVYFVQSTATITMPSGFANAIDVNSTPARIRIDWKIADGSEGATLSWSWTGSAWRLGCLFCVDNAATSGTPVEGGSTVTTVNTSSPSNSTLAVNASVDDMVFLAGANPNANSGTWAQPGSWTLQQSFAADDLGVGSIAQAAGGKPAAAAMTISTSTGNCAGAILAAMSPAAALFIKRLVILQAVNRAASY